MAEAAFAELIRRPPTRKEISNTAEVATAITQACEADGKLIIAGADRQELHIAPAISELIVDLLRHIARGEMVTIIGVGAMLTTQEAADILNVSRPFLSGCSRRRLSRSSPSAPIAA